jgi:hypothetical protein
MTEPTKSNGGGRKPKPNLSTQTRLKGKRLREGKERLVRATFAAVAGWASRAGIGKKPSDCFSNTYRSSPFQMSIWLWGNSVAHVGDGL